MNFAEKVKHIRKVELKLTQAELAKLCEVSRSYIGEIEQGRVVGNLNIITKLSKISNKPIDNGLISSDGKMDKDTEEFLNKTLMKEIMYKLSIRNNNK